MSALDDLVAYRDENRELAQQNCVLESRVNELEAEVSVLRACNDEINSGNGPCGICIECLRAENERLREAIEQALEYLYRDKPYVKTAICDLEAALGEKQK